MNIKLNKKSIYLKNLEHRRIYDHRKYEEEKSDYLFDKIIGNNKIYNRDYKRIFFLEDSINNYNNFSDKEPKKLKVIPGIKLNIISNSEKVYPNKYKIKDYDSDKFAQIFKSENNVYHKKSKSLVGESINKNRNKSKSINVNNKNSKNNRNSYNNNFYYNYYNKFNYFIDKFNNSETARQNMFGNNLIKQHVNTIVEGKDKSDYDKNKKLFLDIGGNIINGN